MTTEGKDATADLDGKVFCAMKHVRRLAMCTTLQTVNYSKDSLQGKIIHFLYVAICHRIR